MKNKNWLLFIIPIVIILIVLAVPTYGLFTASPSTEDEARVALISFETKTLNVPLKIDELLAGEEIEYIFETVNYKDDDVSEVTVVYQIKIDTLGLIPLEFYLYKGDSNTNLLTDYVSSYQTMLAGVKTKDSYKLVIKMPDDASHEIAGIVDYIDIVIEALQEVS